MLGETVPTAGVKQPPAELAEKIPGPSTEYFGDLAAKNNLHIALSLYEREHISFEKLLQALAKLSRRGTIKPGWIVSALKMTGVLRSRSPNKGERRNEKD